MGCHRCNPAESWQPSGGRLLSLLMTHKMLLSVPELQALQNAGDCIIVDCRFDLADLEAGYENYLDSHIPGAVYAHLDDDLSDPVSGSSGRHPLPDAGKFAEFLARSGWRPGKLLVAYDDAGGAIAARLWWLMKYFGQDCAALLDGGIPAWWAAGCDVESGQSKIKPVEVTALQGHEELEVSTAEVMARIKRKEIVLADARANERFIGRVEPIDKLAGHIPGSMNYPYNRNLNANGTFKFLDEIRHGLQELCGNKGPDQLVHMCGSGVTACQNLFSAELVGLKGSTLYVGSWSEWIRDPSRPIGKLPIQT